MKINLSGRMKNVAKISSGSVMGQIISIVTLPVITRIYGADIIGGWTAIYAISSILVYLCDLGLSQAIMVEEDEKIERLYQIITTVSLVLSIVSMVPVFLYYRFAMHQSMSEAVINGLFVVVYTFTFRQAQTCYTWLNREKQYNILMKNPVINYSAAAAVSVVLGVAGMKQYGYYIGTTLGQVITLIHMKRRLPKRMFCFSWNETRAAAVEHAEFVKYQMPAQITAQLRHQLPNLLIGSLFGETMLGYFSISQKLISIPINFIGQALGKVFYQTLAELKRTGRDVAAFVERNMTRSMKILFVPMILFAAFGDAAIVMFFGAEYAIGGTISRIMVFRGCFTFISTALTGIDIVLQKQKYSMLTCVFQTIFASLGVIVTYYSTQNIYVCTFVIVAVFIVAQMWYFGRMYRFLNLEQKRYYKNMSLLLAAILICSYILRWGFCGAAELTGWSFLLWLKGFMVL